MRLPEHGQILKFANTRMAASSQFATSKMTPFFYRCPNTGVQLQGWAADDGAENAKEIYEGNHCPVCDKLHFVNPQTGKVLGIDED
jgi:hypothetical protein